MAGWDVLSLEFAKTVAAVFAAVPFLLWLVREVIELIPVEHKSLGDMSNLRLISSSASTALWYVADSDK